jgi:quinoprotein glucose dehydrogenase
VGAIPTLQNVSTRLTNENIKSILRKGRGQMPSFPNLSDEELEALVTYLLNDSNVKASVINNSEGTLSSTIRYVHEGWNVLADQDGYPGVKPPWGTLNAIDLNSGELLWKIPLGEFAELTEKGIPQTGTPNLGGPVVTAGGLIFIGATKDEKFRAFDKTTGELVWEYNLPAGGYATPSTYMMNGKQYIVIAAGGGGKVGSPSGDAYVAFSLK